MAVVLKDEFGFGPKRIIKAMEAMNEKVAPINAGMIGWRDFKKYAEEYTGVKIDEIDEAEWINEKK